MLHFAYLVGLISGIAGVLCVDWRWRLVIWRDWRRTTLTVLVGWSFFIVWDLLLLGTGVIYPGESPYTLHLYVWPGMPIEELLFLGFLAYQPLVIWEGYKGWKAR